MTGASKSLIEWMRRAAVLLLQGTTAVGSTGAELDRVVKDALAKWGAVVKAAKIKVA
jgi:tripartite-type tricarboxylate transporter receptor subunit TctC